MRGGRNRDEFEVEAVKRVTERGHSVPEVAHRLGISTHELDMWKAKFAQPNAVRRAELHENVEVRRLNAELKGVTQERDVSNEAATYFAQEVKANCAFMRTEDVWWHRAFYIAE